MFCLTKKLTFCKNKINHQEETIQKLNTETAKQAILIMNLEKENKLLHTRVKQEMETNTVIFAEATELQEKLTHLKNFHLYHKLTLIICGCIVLLLAISVLIGK